MKKHLLIILIVGLSLFGLWRLLGGEDRWTPSQSPYTIDGVRTEYGVLTAPHQYSFAMVGDTVHRKIYNDSARHTRSYKNTHNVFYGFILKSTWTIQDTAHSRWQLEGGTYDSSANWTVIDSGLMTNADSAATYYDTTILYGRNLNYNYYRYAFASGDDYADSAKNQVDFLVTTIAQPDDYWIRGSSADTTQLIQLPYAYTNHTLWYKCQRKDSIKVYMRALVSYDGICWVVADSVLNAGVTDSLQGFKAFDLPDANQFKIQLIGDTANGKTDYDYINGDSSGMRGTLVRASVILTR